MSRLDSREYGRSSVLETVGRVGGAVMGVLGASALMSASTPVVLGVAGIIGGLVGGAWLGGKIGRGISNSFSSRSSLNSSSYRSFGRSANLRYQGA